MDVSDEADAEPWGKDEKRITKIVFIGNSPNSPCLISGVPNSKRWGAFFLIWEDPSFLKHLPEKKQMFSPKKPREVG